MTTGYDYFITVRSEGPVPQDVLVEHIAVALRDFKEVKMTVLPRVVTAEAGFDIMKEFQMSFDPSKLKAADGAEEREMDEWERELLGLKPEKPHPFDGPTVFDDAPLNKAELTALDPYPLVTRALSSLAARKAHGREAD